MSNQSKDHYIIKNKYSLVDLILPLEPDGSRTLYKDTCSNIPQMYSTVQPRYAQARYPTAKTNKSKSVEQTER